MGRTHGELLDLALRDMRPRRAVDALHGLLHRDAAGVLGHTLSQRQRVQLGREVERAVEREVVDLRGLLGRREAVQMHLAEERLQRAPGVMDDLATAGGEGLGVTSIGRRESVEMALVEPPQHRRTAVQDVLIDDAVRRSLEHLGVEPAHHELEFPAGRSEAIDGQRKAWFHGVGVFWDSGGLHFPSARRPPPWAPRSSGDIARTARNHYAF